MVKERGDIEAITYYRKASEQGHREAQFCLSQCLLRVRSKYMSAAADVFFGTNGLNDEQRGNLHEMQPELAVENNEAIKWWMLAVRNGLADAQLALAKLGVEPPDPDDIYSDLPRISKEESIEWLCKAVAQGNEDAIEYLLEGTSIGVSFIVRPNMKDYPHLLEALQYAAEKGNAEAAFFWERSSVRVTYWCETMPTHKCGSRRRLNLVI